MRLVKACRSEHLPKFGGSLQVGTYNYYRGIENQSLRDDGEGTRSFSIRINSGARLPKATANHLLQGAISFGCDDPGPGLRAARLNLKSHTGATRFSPQADGTVELDGDFTITAYYDNIFVFCMSLVDDGEAPQFDGYDAEWSLPLESASQLADGIAEALLGHVNDATLNGFSRDLFPEGKAEVRFACGEVEYGQRGLELLLQERGVFELGEQLDHGQLLIKLDEAMGKAPFLKPSAYASEREFRFIFEVGTPLLTLPPKIDRLLLPLDDGRGRKLKDTLLGAKVRIGQK